MVRCICVLMTLGWACASIAAPRHSVADVDWSGAYASHPTVESVRRLGHLTPATRVNLLRGEPPLDRALAIVSAMTSKQARAFKVADSLLQSLSAALPGRDPEGAPTLRVNQLTPRQALLIGWSRAREGSSTTTITTDAYRAAPEQLLQLARERLPNQQAAQLALALFRALHRPQVNAKERCAAWVSVQAEARNGRKAAVALSQAESSRRAVAHLARYCRRAKRRQFEGALQLPPPPPERIISRASSVGPTIRRGRGGRGVAFATAAPIFRGYLDQPAVRDVLRVRRLPVARLSALIAPGASPDVALAVLNAAALTRRMSPTRAARALLATIRKNTAARPQRSAS